MDELGVIDDVIRGVYIALHTFRAREQSDVDAVRALEAIGADLDRVTVAACFYYEALALLSEGLGMPEWDLHERVMRRVRSVFDLADDQ